MKNFYLFSLLLLPSCLFAQQKAQIGAYFTADMPVRSIMPSMSTNAGAGLQFAYKPMSRFPMMLELKGSIGAYSHRTLNQTYIFSTNSTTNVNVNYSSSMNKVLFGTKFHIGHEYKAVRGFITPQIGAAFMRSRIVIDDPADADDCRALERKTTQRSSGFVYGGEAGVEVSMEKLFRGIQTENKHRLYASVNFMKSFEPFEYTNVKYMKDHDHMAMPEGSEGTATEDGRAINTTFINVSTNSLHEHKIAELYKTNLQFWGFSIGYVFNF